MFKAKPQDYEKAIYAILVTLDRMNIKARWWVDDREGLSSSHLSKYAFTYGYGGKY